MKHMALLAALAITLTASVLPAHASADEAESQKAVLITGASPVLAATLPNDSQRPAILSTPAPARQRTSMNSTRSITSWRYAWMSQSRMRSMQPLN